MDIHLTAVEARVLGSLIEKGLTTPDQYPLSLNAVANACNQKSNREPTMNLEESQIMEALDSLLRKHLIREKNTAGSRVAKYAHRLSDSLRLTFDFSANELGTLCVLMLRGPQTVGEVRSRTARLCAFASLDEVEETFKHLVERDDGPYVIQLPLQPGRKEPRYAHLLCGEVQVVEQTTPVSTTKAQTSSDRIAELEREINVLRIELDELKRRFADRFGDS